MAVEFRHRDWLSGDQLQTTVTFLRTLRVASGGVALISCDDLEHEVYMRESEVMNLAELPRTATNNGCSNSKSDNTINYHNSANTFSSASSTSSTSNASVIISCANNSSSSLNSSNSTNTATTTTNNQQLTTATHLPIVLNTTSCAQYAYVRVHRR
eukprot:gene26097-32627_t